MVKTSLSDKKIRFGHLIDIEKQHKLEGCHSNKIIFQEEDVKEKVQNAQKRLKKEIKHDIKQEDNWEGFEWSIDKIFKQEFGDKLTKSKSTLKRSV